MIGIIKPDDFVDNPSELAVGMTSALIGAFFLIFVATYFSLPVSATHSISFVSLFSTLPRHHHHHH
jgi:phosphate/sulfate permease